jgi:phosphate transport system substrate-binding protein
MARNLATVVKVAVVLALCVTPTQANASAEKSSGLVKIQIEGSTTVGPIADAFKEAFEKMHENVRITVNKTGSGDGAAALIDGRCDVANMSRFMKDSEFKKAVEKGVMPVAHVVAMDAVCIIVHPSNSVAELTQEQVKAIYQNKITNWKQLGGPDEAIVPFSRETSSGTYETFHSFLIGKADKIGKVEGAGSNPQMHARVSKTTGAIGYVGLGFVDRKVKAVRLNGVLPTRKSVLDGSYLASRPLFMFTNKYPKLGSMVQKFVAFYLTEKGQEIIETKGFVPVTRY